MQFRLLLLLAGIGTITAASLWGLIWWEERPLADAQALLADDPNRAIQILNQFLTTHPHHSDASLLKARALVALQRWDEAVRLYSSTGAETDEDWHRWAQALLHLERWLDALPLLEKVLQSEPENPHVLHEISGCLAKLKRLNDALVFAEKLSQISGNEARGFLLMGTIHVDLGNEKSAAEAFQSTLEFAPDAQDLQLPDWEFLREYAHVLVKIGQTDQAIPFLERSIQKRPTADAYVTLGTARLQNGDTEKAREAWTKAVNKDSSNWEARHGLAQIAMRQNLPEQAIAWLMPLTQASDVRSSSTYLLHQAHAKLKNTVEADRWQAMTVKLQRLEKLNATANQLLIDSPNSFWANVVLAYRFAADKNWLAAEQLVAKIAKDELHEPFVLKLIECINSRGELPSLELLPVNEF